MWYVSDGRSNHPPHLDGYSRQSNEVTEVGERSQRWEGSPPKEADHELYLSSLGVQLEEQACSWSGQMKVSTVISTVSVGRLLTGVHSWVTAGVTTDGRPDKDFKVSSGTWPTTGHSVTLMLVRNVRHQLFQQVCVVLLLARKLFYSVSLFTAHEDFSKTR